ncbi:MAG: zinc-dependent metalloprotease [Planctomycetota bacterium]
MSPLSSWFSAVLRSSAAVLLCLSLGSPLLGEEVDGAEAGKPEVAAESSSDDSKSSDSKASSKPASKPSKYPPVSKVLKDTDAIDGLLKLHHKDDKLFAELKSSDLNKDLIVLITIAKGIGQTPLLGGFSWGFGDDWVWQFRKVGERIQVVRRNVRFRAKPGTPSAEAVKLAYTDSVLFSLPIATRGSGGSYVIDLTPVFFSDLPQIGMALPGFSFSKQRSSFLKPQGYDRNVEIQVAATYSSGGYMDLETVPDSRAATINVHYSISRLPKTDYRPRLADNRIGYFLTVVKDFSKPEDEDRFVRYINRWDLQKADPKADVSPPKEPIKFWLEKTIPYKYRKPIRDGIEEWNYAFEKAGFYDAIDVDQQPDDAKWDPGDINYNTFRWITSDAGFAMGPSRVNPLTGQILDADIIFDADFLQFWKQEYEVFTPQGIEMLTGGPVELGAYREQQRRLPMHVRNGHTGRCSCNLLGGASQQMAFAAAVNATRKRSDDDMERLIMEGLKEVTMHEVGHTLGLRHNFKASTQLGLDELHDTKKTAETGLSASVMDYHPTNLAPPGVEQGDYYSKTIGSYDYWAVEYGYTPVKDEKKALKEIASRSGEPGLAYSTDEDTRGIDPDPHSRRFDMSDDLVGYAQQRAEIVADALPKVVEELVGDGEDYDKALRGFQVLLATHGRAMFDASRYVGGLYVSRSHKGDKNAPKPFEVVDADKQRAAMDLLGEQVFSDQPFLVPRELYNQLAPTKWSHWGTRTAPRADYPVHEVILLWQERILDRLMATLTLRRLHDNELKAPAEDDVFTTAELIQGLSSLICTEWDGLEEGEYTPRKPAISSLRRNLQRAYIERLAEIAMGRYYISFTSPRGGARSAIIDVPPQDCQTLAFVELEDLREKIDLILEDDPEVDRYTEAHLRETSSRIEKVLESEMLSFPLRNRFLDEQL